MAKYLHLTGTVSKLQLEKRLDKTAAKLFPHYSRSQIKTWILKGLVKVNGQVSLIPKEKILGGEYIEIKVFIEETPQITAQAMSLNIVYEDNDILVINKPHNLVVHPGAGHTNDTMLNALLHYFPPIVEVTRSGIVHRLDKDTTGLMIVAKTTLAHTRLVESLKAREIIREYEAITIGNITTGGTVDYPITRNITKRTHMMVHSMGKPAITHYRIIERFRTHTHLRLRLETGRTHQIRVHMAHINHPLLGDPLYGGRLQLPKRITSTLNKVLCSFNRQALHATMLQFSHPITSIRMEWYAPLPQSMAVLIAALKADTETFSKEHEL